MSHTKTLDVRENKKKQSDTKINFVSNVDYKNATARITPKAILKHFTKSMQDAFTSRVYCGFAEDRKARARGNVLLE